jgi:pimeloyl-ACP methyl ester carboxylesterase
MPDAPETVVLIHGLWMTPRSWEGWIERYEQRGMKVLAPSWPGMEAEVEELNRDPSPIARQDIRRIVDHYEDIIRELEAPPIIMGHSFGGTFTQLLLARAVALDAKQFHYAFTNTLSREESSFRAPAGA